MGNEKPAGWSAGFRYLKRLDEVYFRLFQEWITDKLPERHRAVGLLITAGEVQADNLVGIEINHAGPGVTPERRAIMLKFIIFGNDLSQLTRLESFDIVDI